MTSLPASDSGSTAVWGSKRINPRPQSCLCLTWSGYPSNDDDDDPWFEKHCSNGCSRPKAKCFFSETSFVDLDFRTISSRFALSSTSLPKSCRLTHWRIYVLKAACSLRPSKKQHRLLFSSIQQHIRTVARSLATLNPILSFFSSLPT